MNAIAYVLLRLAVGMSMFGHGFVRLPKLQTFSEGMVEDFEESMLPEVLIIPISYLIPVIELLVGLALLLGLFTKQALIAGGLLMVALIFGTSFIENWSSVPSQLIHVAFFAVLLQFIDSNKWALDKRFNIKPDRT